MFDQNGNINKEIAPKEGKKKLEMKSTITDVKNSLEEFKGRFEQAEKKIQRT